VLGAYAKSLRMKAGEFAVWANGFLFQLTEVVLRYDGIPIKYMGDAFLCFFSGIEHQQRAVKAAGLAKRLITDELVIALHSGEIYLGTMGHPDYAHRDITGEAVNIAFLIRNWAESHMQGSIVVTPSVVEHLDEHCQIVQTTAVNFKGLTDPIDIYELCLT
jgi:class 3 adenylate cyclase